MKRFFAILFLLAMLFVGTFSVRGQQRLNFTNLNPPTSCVPGHVVTNTGLNPAKAWVGTSTGACTPIDPASAGAVIGPGSATAGDLPLLDATGKVLSDSGKAPSTDGTFGSNSDLKIPTEKAVKTYADTKAPIDNPAFTTQVKSPVFVTNAADPADTNAIRLGNNEFIAWEKFVAGTDWTLGVNASDVLQTNAAFRALTITDDGLTAGRVPIVGTAGLIQDDADLTFSGGDTLNATKLISSLVNGLTITNNGTNTLNIAAGKSLVALKSLSFTAADDTGTYTLPTGTKTLLAADGSAASLTSFPTLNQNTSGTAANLSGTPALPNDTTATTQSQADASTKLATTAYVDTGLGGKQATISFGTGVLTALGVNVGTAGAPVVNGGVLGSPSSAGTIPAFTLGGTIAGGGNQINNIIIGTTTPLAGFFTTLSATGHVTVEGVTSTGATGTGKFAFDTSPTFATSQTTSAGDPSIILQRNVADATSAGGFQFRKSDGTVKWEIGSQRAVAGSNFEINEGASANNRFLITAGGAVSIPGLSTSSAGTTGTVCWTTGSGLINVDTTTTCLLSARKYKRNINPLRDNLSTVLRLRPVSYFLKSDPTNIGEQEGLVADEVAKVDPSLVSLEADGSPHAVRYQQLTARLTGAIQELNDKFETYKKATDAKLASQQRTIQRLRHRK